MRALFYFIYLVTFLLIPPCSTCQSDPLSGIADQLASKVRDTRKHNMFPKVVINSFIVQPEGGSQLTEHISDSLSNLLAERLGPGAVISRPIYRDTLEQRLLSPADLQDLDVADWIAKGLGANIMILGSVAPSGKEINLEISAIRVSDRKPLFSLASRTTLPEDWMKMSGKPIQLPARPRLAVVCSASTDKETVNAFKSAGVTFPKCTTCPDPSYTNDARIAKFQGSIRVKAIVNENGHVLPIRVLDEGPPNLIVQMLSTLEHWKMDPAERGGIPVPVCIVIENTFQLF